MWVLHKHVGAFPVLSQIQLRLVNLGQQTITPRLKSAGGWIDSLAPSACLIYFYTVALYKLFFVRVPGPRTTCSGYYLFLDYSFFPISPEWRWPLAAPSLQNCYWLYGGTTQFGFCGLPARRTKLEFPQYVFVFVVGDLFTVGAGKSPCCTAAPW